MKETIYTIPVTEVFSEQSECPVCELEKRFENDCVNYFLGPSLMEPENRIETNETGFCSRHFELMYNTQTNRLGLGLILDTYLIEQNNKLSKLINSNNNGKKSFLGKRSGDTNTEKILDYLKQHEKQCSICNKLSYTMERYMEVIFYLYTHEQDFKNTFNEGKGFCFHHLQNLIECSEKYLSGSRREEFIEALFSMQLKNMNRISDEVNWFTKKFDYRNNDKPWGNSKDALIRGIKKVTGIKELK